MIHHNHHNHHHHHHHHHAPPCTRYDAPFNERSAALLHAVTEALAHSRARPRNTAGCDRPCTLFTAAASHVATPSGGTANHELRVHTDTGPPVGLDLTLELVSALRPVMTLVLEPAHGSSPAVVVRVRTCQVLNGVNINLCIPLLSAFLLRCKLAQSLEPTTSAARATSAGDVLDVSMDSLALVHSDADGLLLRQRTHSCPVLATPRRPRSNTQLSSAGHTAATALEHTAVQCWPHRGDRARQLSRVSGHAATLAALDRYSKLGACRHAAVPTKSLCACAVTVHRRTLRCRSGHER